MANDFQAGLIALGNNRQRASLSMTYEVSTSRPSTTPARAALARPGPISAATSCTETGCRNERCCRPAEVITGMCFPLSVVAPTKGHVQVEWSRILPETAANEKPVSRVNLIAATQKNERRHLLSGTACRLLFIPVITIRVVSLFGSPHDERMLDNRYCRTLLFGYQISSQKNNIIMTIICCNVPACCIAKRCQLTNTACFNSANWSRRAAASSNSRFIACSCI